MCLKFFTALFLVAGCAATVVVHTPCTDLTSLNQDACNVAEVRINPCVNGNKCSLRKGKNATISFDFTPNFSAAKLTTGLSSPNSVLGDLPFSELDQADGCTLTPCPVESGKSQQLNYNLRLSKKLPNGDFMLRWRLWNQADESQMCCFKAWVHLRR